MGTYQRQSGASSRPHLRAKVYSLSGFPPTWKEDNGSPITADPEVCFATTAGPDDTLWTLGAAASFADRRAWSEFPCEVPSKLPSILLRGLVATTNNVWAVGGQERWRPTNLPAGSLRTYPTLDSSLTLYGVYVPPSGDVYAVGERGLVLRLPKP